MKNTEGIYQQMLEQFRQRSGTDPEQGCDVPLRLYAAAAQIYALHVQGEWVLRQCFPQTAQAEYLQHHAQMRGLKRKPAVAATGVVRFVGAYVAETDRVIASGSVVMTADLRRFETTREATLKAGEDYVDIEVRAVAPGAQGNIAKGTIVSLAAVPTGISQCTNLERFQGGADEEDDDSLRVRVLDSYTKLPNGVNSAFYEKEALSFDQVKKAQVIPRHRGIGTVDIFIATQEGIPSQALIEEVAQHFQTRREIAVDVEVREPELIGVNFEARLAVKPGYSFEQVAQTVRTALTNWFSGERLGQNVLLAQLGELIYGCEGVHNYQILDPMMDLPMEPSMMPELYNIDLEEMW